MDFSSTAISDAPEAEGLAARAVRARHLFTIKTYILPGEFMSGPEAEGQGGAAGAARGSKGRLLQSAPWSGFGAEGPDPVGEKAQHEVNKVTGLSPRVPE